MDYLLVKYLHVTCVLISVSLFVLRGTLQLQSKPWRQWRLLRVALTRSPSWGLLWRLGMKKLRKYLLFVIARPQAVAIHVGVPMPWIAALRSQ